MARVFLFPTKLETCICLHIWVNDIYPHSKYSGQSVRYWKQCTAIPDKQTDLASLLVKLEDFQLTVMVWCLLQGAASGLWSTSFKSPKINLYILGLEPAIPSPLSMNCLLGQNLKIFHDAVNSETTTEGDSRRACHGLVLWLNMTYLWKTYEEGRS